MNSVLLVVGEMAKRKRRVKEDTAFLNLIESEFPTSNPKARYEPTQGSATAPGGLICAQTLECYGPFVYPRVHQKGKGQS